MTTDVKFSQFTVGGDMMVGDQPVGLRSGSPTQNFLFSFPGAGVKDANGNYMVKWLSNGPNAVNSIAFENSITGNPVEITALGSDSNIGITIQPKGTGAVTLGPNTFPTTQLTDGELLIGSTGNPLVAAGITAGAGITVTPGPGSITLSTAGFPIFWVNVSTTSQTALPNTGYVTSNASQTTVTLPDHPAFGTFVAVAGNGAAGWKILPGPGGATINIGSASTTTSVTSSNRYDSLTLVAIATDTWSAWNGPQTAGLTLA